MKIIVIAFLLLISVTCNAATIRGTVIAVTPTTIDVVYGPGEAIRMVRVSIKGLALSSVFKPGDIVEIESEIAEQVKRCQVNKFGSVINCE